MRKTLSFFVALVMMVSLFMLMVTPATAAYTLPDNATIERVIKSTKIMIGDENGNMNLSGSVTRAEFAKLLIAASSYKDSVGAGSGLSPFKDVKSTHWASGYIKTAVDAGWVIGYLDGTYRPGNIVLLEEAASAILKLLGYGPSDYIGAYPNAQISKFTVLRLATGLSAKQGSPLTRGECMIIFYNLLSAEQKSGMIYGASLGYPIDSDGYFDYDTYIKSKMEGPFVLTSGTLVSVLPFSAENAKVYRNGKAEEALSASLYDVYYYNEISEEIWIYSNRVVGMLSDITPNKVSPSSVMVGGNNYSLGTDNAKRKVSTSGSFAGGDTVALLLGMNGEVVDIIDAGLIDATYYGMLMSVELATYSTGTNQSTADYIATVACTDGVIRQCTVTGNFISEWTLVSISYSDAKPEVKRLSLRALKGTVNAAATKLGDYAFATNIEIMELSGKGEWTTLYPNRLSNADLSDGIEYYLLNEKNEIAVLILKNITGDMYSYGVITSIAENRVTLETGETRVTNRTYSYLIDGKPGTFSISGRLVGIDKGSCFLTGSDRSILSTKSLNKVSLSEISTVLMTAVGENKKYAIADSVQAYLYVDSNYYPTELSAVSDTSVYSAFGYYENEFPAGGQLRVIVATRKAS